MLMKLVAELRKKAALKLELKLMNEANRWIDSDSFQVLSEDELDKNSCGELS